MKEKTKQKAAIVLEAAALLMVVYPLGLTLGFLFWAGKICRAVKVLHAEKLACLKTLDKKILVSNHPAVIDPFLVAALLVWYYALHPLRHAPLIVADRLNFYDSWWFWPFRPVMVPVDRDSERKKASALLRIKRAIDLGRPLIIFPEGGRTFKGENGGFLYSKRGAKIRFLQGGIGLLVRKTGATVIPIGIKGSDKVVPNSKKRLFTRFIFGKKVTIALGEPMNFGTDTPRERVTQEIASQILKLIDEASASQAGATP